tara:strand:+ start:1304 stop:2692 length:1389 start_codon:yes stop_codon:yes gene_type:complete
MVNIKVRIIRKKTKNRQLVLGFTIPIKELRKIKSKEGDFIKISIKKREKETNYYISIKTKCPSRKHPQIRRAIPKEIVKKLRIKANDIIKLKISSIKDPRTKKLINNGKIDILATIPEKTNSNQKIMIDYNPKKDKEYCNVWYCSGHGQNIKPIKLKRWIKINKELGEFFGLMQAESRKTGTKFDFTNNLISEHKIFINVTKEFGIPKESWKYSFFYNPNMKKKTTIKQISKFKKEFNINYKVNPIKNERLTKVAFCCCINKTLLGQIMINLLCQIRSTISHDETFFIKNINNFAKGFISKTLLGDGTVVLNKTNKGIVVSISEQDPQSQEDIKKILKKFGIKSFFMQNKIILNTKFKEYLWLLENNAFINHQNRIKLIKLIFNILYIDSFYTRLNIKGETDKEKFSEKHNLSKGTANMYLYRNYKKGFLTKKGKSYQLSKEGKNCINILKRAKRELSLTNT